MALIPTVNGSGALEPPIDRNTGQIMTLANWQKYMTEFVEFIRRNVSSSKEIVHKGTELETCQIIDIH